MTQQAFYRMARFRAGSLPDAKATPDAIIAVHSIDESQTTMLYSDGENWLPLAAVPPVASLGEAIVGTDNEKVITPLRLAQVLAFYGVGVSGSNTYVDAGYVENGYVN